MPERKQVAGRQQGAADGIARAHEFVLRNFKRTPALPQIADVAGVSRFHFHRVFRERYGKTPKQLITELQVGEVQRLARGGMSLGDAARAAGFVHQSHMTLRFKQLVGQTPRRWLTAVRAGTTSVIAWGAPLATLAL